jgi:hypothetical protein
MAQVRQPPLQASLQQNPSTQKLLEHSAAHPQGSPAALLTPPPSGPAQLPLLVGVSMGWSTND